MDQERTCAKCGQRSAGPGGILCPPCRTLLADLADNYWQTARPLDTAPAAGH